MSMFKFNENTFKVIFYYSNAQRYTECRVYESLGEKEWRLVESGLATCSKKDRFEKAVGRAAAFLDLVRKVKSKEFARAIGASLRHDGVRLNFNPLREHQKVVKVWGNVVEG